MTNAKLNKWRVISSDILLIALSVFAAIMLVWSGVLQIVIDQSLHVREIGSFVAGMFFTSMITTPIAIVALAHIAQTTPLWVVASFGAVGALVGDLIIFLFIRDKFSNDLAEVISLKRHKRIKRLTQLPIVKWLTFGIGALIIASPLPDELGLTMMGFSKIELKWLIPISLVMNFLGILFIGGIARL